MKSICRLSDTNDIFLENMSANWKSSPEPEENVEEEEEEE